MQQSTSKSPASQQVANHANRQQLQEIQMSMSLILKIKNVKGPLVSLWVFPCFCSEKLDRRWTDEKLQGDVDTTNVDTTNHPIFGADTKQMICGMCQFLARPARVIQILMSVYFPIKVQNFVVSHTPRQPDLARSNVERTPSSASSSTNPIIPIKYGTGTQIRSQ